MKIGILTQPLHSNYGGLLQAYALQKFLQKRGHDVLTVDRGLNQENVFSFTRLLAKRIFRNILNCSWNPIFPEKDKFKLWHFSENMFWFARKHIRTTETIRSPKEAEFLKKYGFDAYIVGSDQVWRPTYSPGMPMFFLDFLGEDATTRRIAYAASFGTDSWEFSSRLTRQCRKLAKKFHAISVREDSGVTLCQKHLGVKSQHVIDPTMLLNPSDYNMLIEDDTHAPGKISTYIFKRSSLAMKVVKFAEKEFGKQEQRLFPYRLNEARKERIPDEKCKFSSMSDWLKGIRDADFVITDSFHGTVFSIIYNKPFLVIGNIRGGLARFQSILKQFGLENRYISSEDQLSPQLLSATIDWAYVNSIRGKLIANAETFLTRALYPENKKNENHGFYAGV